MTVLKAIPSTDSNGSSNSHSIDFTNENHTLTFYIPFTPNNIISYRYNDNINQIILGYKGKYFMDTILSYSSTFDPENEEDKNNKMMLFILKESACHSYLFGNGYSSPGGIITKEDHFEAYFHNISEQEKVRRIHILSH